MVVTGDRDKLPAAFLFHFEDGAREHGHLGDLVDHLFGEVDLPLFAHFDALFRRHGAETDRVHLLGIEDLILMGGPALTAGSGEVKDAESDEKVGEGHEEDGDKESDNRVFHKRKFFRRER